MAASNCPFVPNSYVPILKAKRGELSALTSLSPVHRNVVIPLLEVPPSLQPGAVASAWPDDNNVVMVHPLNLEEADDDNWATFIGAFFQGLRDTGTRAVPVVTTDDASQVIEAVEEIVSIDGRGLCLRIDAETLILESPGSVDQLVGRVLDRVGIRSAECDVVLDIGLIRDSVASRIAAAEAGIRALPNVGEWRNIVCAFSAFPENVGSVAPNGITTPVPRDDAACYRALVGRNLPRLPTYSDYAIGTPFYENVPWAPIPSIKYTTADNWMIHRGSTRDNRNAQYIELAQDLVSAPYFAGGAFSQGDSYLSDVAAGRGGPGNPMTYVRAGTSHHLAFVADRLSTIGEP